MRVKKSLLNAFANSFILILRSILLFIVRIIFVKVLGKEYLGLDSLFTNILICFSITDLGVSNAINFSLYKPLANKDYDKISRLMNFYKKVYSILGYSVLLLGLCLIPFLNQIVNSNIEIKKLVFIYILYLLTTVSTYFISYKDSLISADQNNYKISFILGGTYIGIYIVRIIFLLVYPNFIIYILIQLVGLVLQRILVNRYIDKYYKEVDFKTNKTISKKEQKSMIKNIYSMFMHKIGNYLVSGTDSLIISANKLLGVGVVGVYVNYISVTSIIDGIMYKALSGVTASFGDLAIKENKKVQENVFNIIVFLTFVIYGLFSVGFLFLLTDFIKICFGSTFVLSKYVVLVICLNFYIIGNLRPLDIIKEATGIFYVDRYVPIIQTIINLILSIVMCKHFGLIGVVLGTLLSTILVPLWNKPFMLYKYLFEKSVFSYFMRQMLFFLVIILVSIICFVLFNNIVISNIIISFIVKGVLLVIIYLLSICILFNRNTNFKFLVNLIKKQIKKHN